MTGGTDSEVPPLGCWKSLWISSFLLTVWPALEAAVDDDPGRDTADLVIVGDAETVTGLGETEMLPKVLTCFGCCGVAGGTDSEVPPLGCWKSLWISSFLLTVWPALEAAVDDDPGRDTADLVTVGDAETVAGLGETEMLPKVLICFGSVSVDGGAGDGDGGAELSSIDPN